MLGSINNIININVKKDNTPRNLTFENTMYTADKCIQTQYCSG